MNSGDCLETPGLVTDLSRADESFTLDKALERSSSFEPEGQQVCTDSHGSDPTSFPDPANHFAFNGVASSYEDTFIHHPLGFDDAETTSGHPEQSKPFRAPCPAGVPDSAASSKSQRSEYRGVSYDRKKRKWRVQIKVSTLAHSGFSVGYYQSELEAARAYDRAAIGLLGPDQAERVINFGLSHYDVAAIPRIKGRSREDVKAVLKETRKLTSCHLNPDPSPPPKPRTPPQNGATRSPIPRHPRQAKQGARHVKQEADLPPAAPRKGGASPASNGSNGRARFRAPRAMEGAYGQPPYNGSGGHACSPRAGAHHGVSINASGRWEACVMVNHRCAYRQSFDSEDAANNAFEQAVRGLHHQHATAGYQNGTERRSGRNDAHNWSVNLSDGTPTALYELSGSGNEDVQSGSSGAVCPPQTARSHHHHQHYPHHQAQPQQPQGRAGAANHGGHAMNRGMVKSSSVSTLFAATSLCDAGDAGGGGLPPFHVGSLPEHGRRGALGGGNASAGYDHDPNFSAASLLMGSDGGGGGGAGGASGAGTAPGGHLGTGYDGNAQNPGQGGPPTTDPSASGGSLDTSGSLGRHKRTGSMGSRSVRKSGSVQDLGLLGTGGKSGCGAGVQKPTRTSARNAANRRTASGSAVARGRLVSDGRSSVKEVVAAGAARPAGPGGVKAEDSEEERMRIYKALMLQQERLHEQMRAHQAQHEEQQRRAAQKQAEQAERSGSLTGASGSGLLAGQHSGHYARPGDNGGPGLAKTGRGGRGGHRVGVSGSQAGDSGSLQAGGKMPRVSSEPRALASLGVAGMGGRHQPTTPSRGAPAPTVAPGMRRVQSTTDFYHMPQHHRVPTSAPAPAMRASPSMPALHPFNNASAPGGPHALHHLDEHPFESPGRAMTPLAQLFMEDADTNDDFMNLIRDLADGSGQDFNFDPTSSGDPIGGVAASGGGGGIDAGPAISDGSMANSFLGGVSRGFYQDAAASHEAAAPHGSSRHAPHDSGGSSSGIPGVPQSSRSMGHVQPHLRYHHHQHQHHHHQQPRQQQQQHHQQQQPHASHSMQQHRRTTDPIKDEFSELRALSDVKLEAAPHASDLLLGGGDADLGDPSEFLGFATDLGLTPLDDMFADGDFMDT